MMVVFTYASLVWGLLVKGVPLLFRVPRWVWLGGSLLVVGLYYGHSVATRVRAVLNLEHMVAQQQEAERQQQVFNKALDHEKGAALKAQARVQQLEVQLDDAQQQLKKWKDHGRVCLPASVTNKLRAPLRIHRPPFTTTYSK